MLAVGYLLFDHVDFPTSVVPWLLLVALLFLVSFYFFRHGLFALLSLCLFFVVVGILRAPLPDVHLLSPNLLSWSTKVSQSVVALLRDSGLDDSHSALLEAMLLGQRGGVGEATLQLYRLSGAAHILALSGLHLGVIFGLLHFGLLRLINSRLRYVFGWAGILLMWAYALLTGFPASLCRASVMMSFLFLGQMRLGGSDSWHNLGLAAFLILLFNPPSLFDVGFQLSFTGVFGILLFYSPMAAVWQPRATAVRWLWKGWLVSCAAQVGVLPLLLHYFHYISLLGLIFSPFYILLATLIIYFSLLLIAFHAWGMGSLLCPFVTAVINLQHWLMELSLRLPFDRLVLSTFPWAKVVLLYVALLCLLPSIHSLHTNRIPLPGQRAAFFFRTWPYILSSLILLLTLFLIG